MLYFDTSFLAPLIMNEASSDAVERAMAAMSSEVLAVSHWTRVEFSSLLARKVRMGDITAGDANRADAEFEAILRESFLVLLPNQADFDLSKAFLAAYQTGLRAGDALHLAIASNHGARSIHSLDKGMISAGTTLGLSMRALA